MIDHGNSAGTDPARDRLADAAHADHPDLAIPERTGAQGKTLRGPEPGTQVSVGLDEFAQGRDQKPEREVRDLFGQDIRRVGDDDIALTRVIRVDVIVADAEGGDDLELRKTREHLAVAPYRTEGHRGPADFLRNGRSQSLEVGVGLKRMQHQLVGKTVVDDW